MGVFSLACSCLSAYIWSMTLYDVYAPLSSNIKTTAESVTPATVAATAQNALWVGIKALSGRASSNATANGKATTARKPGRRRKHLTLAETEREELRAALRILIVWLICKGIEPAFDNTAGYVVPFYNAFKAIVLLVFARFRAEMSMHLFEAFIVPIGKPQTPLFDSGALAALFFPAMRFLVSLPFTQIATLLASALTPITSLVERSTGVSVYANTAPAKPSDKPSKLDRSAFMPPPPSNARAKGNNTSQRAISSSAASLRRRDDRGSGPKDGDGGGGGGGSALPGRVLEASRPRSSLSSLAMPSRFMAQPTPRAVSQTDRLPPGIEARSISQLQALPSPPQDLPVNPFAGHHPSSAASSSVFLPSDIVPPPPYPRISSPRSSLTSSPRMPGTLGRHTALSHGSALQSQNGSGNSYQPHDEVTDDSKQPLTGDVVPQEQPKLSPASKRRHDEVSNAASLRAADDAIASELAEPDQKTRKTNGATTRARSKTPATRRTKAADTTTYAAAAPAPSTLSRSRARTPATRVTRSRGATPQQ